MPYLIKIYYRHGIIQNISVNLVFCKGTLECQICHTTNYQSNKLQSYLSVLSGLVHGNLFPIILFQFTFTNKYNVMIIPVILRTIAIMIDIGLSVFVNSEITRWTNGLPKSTPIHTIELIV